MNLSFFKGPTPPRAVRYTVAGLSACILAFVTQSAPGQDASLYPAYDGHAMALQIQLAGATPLTVVDSGLAPTNGGLTQNVLWDTTQFGVNGRGFYAMSDGVQGVDRSSSTITLLDLPVLDHRLVVQYIKVDAYARSEFTGVSTSGTTVIGQLVLDGQKIDVTGAPNQKYQFSDGYLMINEQKASADGSLSGAIAVNGLRMVIYDKADVFVCSARAALTRPHS